MLDVHPLPQAAHGWREFLIHIATIAIGLLVALGLEQFVVYTHHRVELSKLRRELALEVADNEKVLTHNREWAMSLGEELRADLALLRAPPPPPGGALHYTSRPAWPLDGPWQAAKQSASIALMPHAELDRFVYLHETITAVKESLPPLALELERARAIANRAADGALSTRDVDELIAATSEAQARLAYAERVFHYEGMGLETIHSAPAP